MYERMCRASAPAHIVPGRGRRQAHPRDLQERAEATPERAPHDGAQVTDRNRTGEPFQSGARYRTIVADPPWEIGDFPPNFGYATGKPCPYPTMAIEEIAALPVQRPGRQGRAPLPLDD